MLVEQGANLRFLNEYGELESVDPASLEKLSGVSASGVSGAGVLLIVPLSDIFMFPFKNSYMYSFIPDTSKCASG